MVNLVLKANVCRLMLVGFILFFLKCYVAEVNRLSEISLLKCCSIVMAEVLYA